MTVSESLILIFPRRLVGTRFQFVNARELKISTFVEEMTDHDRYDSRLKYFIL